MRNILLPLILFCVAIMGCTTSPVATPIQAAIASREAYNSALSGLIKARAAGLINDEQKKKIEVIRTQAYDALELIDSAALANPPISNSDALIRFRDLIDRLLTEQLRSTKAKSSTQPGG